MYDFLLPENIKSVMNIRYAFGLATLLFTLTVATQASAQKPGKMTREEYVATYAQLAMRQQQQYGIPASIKIAQGLLESGYGNSDLSKRSNNHFGIKCKSNWIGDTVRYDDDALQECFRRYSSIEDSYRDHSEFLRSNKRYAGLFELNPKDYKGWAKGLKQCGYATAPHYANTLIKFIEDYELYLLDDGELPSYCAGITAITPSTPNLVEQYPVVTPVELLDIDNITVSVFKVGDRNVYQQGGSRYILAREGDSFSDIAKLLGISEKRLKRFNKKNLPSTITTGNIIYIERPRKA